MYGTTKCPESPFVANRISPIETNFSGDFVVFGRGELTLRSWWVRTAKIRAWASSGDQLMAEWYSSRSRSRIPSIKDFKLHFPRSTEDKTSSRTSRALPCPPQSLASNLVRGSVRNTWAPLIWGSSIGANYPLNQPQLEKYRGCP